MQKERIEDIEKKSQIDKIQREKERREEIGMIMQLIDIRNNLK